MAQTCDKCGLFSRPALECLFYGVVRWCTHMGEVTESV